MILANFLKPGRNTQGFTLIELMVVISIIGMLSSIVLASLVKARQSGLDGKIIQQVHQMRNQLELEYSENNSFAALLPFTWVSTQANCNLLYSGTYAAKAREICGAIVTSSASNFACSTCYFYMGVDTASGFTASNNFSIMAYLPGSGVMYCVGNSGRTSKVTAAQFSINWPQPGCWGNP